MNKTKHSLFREAHSGHGGHYISYTSDANNFMLAFGKNGDPRNQVKAQTQHKTRTQFLVIPMCGSMRCEGDIPKHGKRKRFAGGRARQR